MTERGGTPKATDPIVLSEPPTGDQLVALWRATDGRFPESRARIRAAFAIQDRDVSTLPDGTSVAAGDALEGLTLPQRLMAVTMSNSLASQYGTPELTRYGRPVASDNADEIETVLKATMERLLSAPDLFATATQAGEWGVVVVPAAADWAHVPQYSEDGYALDEHDRTPDDDDYAGRDGARSRRKFDRDYLDFLAQQPYVVVDLIDPTDCAPILVRGTRGRRWEARGLLVRRLFSRDELLGMGYRCPALEAEKATLIPRGDRGTRAGQAGQLWLYAAYLTLWDEDEEELVPCIAYSVAGQDTTRHDRSADGAADDGAALINLKKDYGIATPMWGYYHGLRTASTNPDMAGLPFMTAYADLLLAFERMMAASLHHAERSSFRGSWVEPGENVPPEAYTETVDNQLRLKSYDAPRSGELVTAPGRVVPDAPPPLGQAAQSAMGMMAEQLASTAPDPANPAGHGASGHAVSLSSGLLEAAHGDIPRGVIECYEDVACWVLECLVGVMRTFDVPYVLDANEELPPDAPGGHRFVSQRYVLKEADVGSAYKVSAAWRARPDPVNVTLMMDRAVKGFASVADVLEAAGETNTVYKIAEILYYRAVMTPGSPENLELSAYVARKRGEAEKAEQQELQAKQLLGPQGTPEAAIAPEATEMANAAGGGPPSGVATGAKSSIAATVQGATQGGPMAADAMAAGQMGIRPATPPPNGAAAAMPGGAGGPV